MNFYHSLLYFEKRTFWSIIALISSIIFTLSTFVIFYFVINSAYSFDKDVLESETNLIAIKEYEDYLKHDIVTDVKFNEIAPQSYWVIYNLDTEKDIERKIKENNNESISDTEAQLIEKFSTKEFKIMQKDLKIPQNTKYEVIAFNDYYFNKILPFFIIGTFFFIIVAIASFLRERVIYKDKAQFDNI